jgi:predicted anti-sigma-YlaC factor YlaD
VAPVVPRCARARDSLELFVDGELDDRRAAGLRAHLERCDRCRAHHAEATSLPSRLAALPSPEPPPNLVHDVLRRVREGRIGPLRLWGPLAAEALLVLVALWYGSGVGGLLQFLSRTAADLGALLSWGTGDASLPTPTAGDLFLLLIDGLLVAVTLYHLTLLSKQSRRLS